METLHAYHSGCNPGPYFEPTAQLSVPLAIQHRGGAPNQEGEARCFIRENYFSSQSHVSRE